MIEFVVCSRFSVAAIVKAVDAIKNEKEQLAEANYGINCNE